MARLKYYTGCRLLFHIKLISLIVLLHKNEAANILFLPKQQKGRVLAQLHLAKELLKRGHSVYMGLGSKFAPAVQADIISGGGRVILFQQTREMNQTGTFENYLTKAIAILLHKNEAANILFLPKQQKGCVLAQLHLAKELLKRGHSVYMGLGSKFAPAVQADIISGGGRVILFQQTREMNQTGTFENYLTKAIASKTRLDTWSFQTPVGDTYEPFHTDCYDMWKDPDFLGNIHKIQFDVAYIEVNSFMPCGMLIPYNFSIPVVTEIHYLIPWLIRVPALPSFVPLTKTPFTDKMTFSERLVNFCLYIIAEYWPVIPQRSNTTLLTKYGPKLRTWNDLLRIADLYVVTRDHSLERPQPFMPNMVMVPGFSFSKAKFLPVEIEKIMNIKQNGVIVTSFGSILNKLPAYVINKFLESFQNIEQTVIFSYAGDVSKLITVPPNVYILPWFPQNDVLGHTNTRLFITHGGHKGQLEATYHGVPIISLGITHEQVHNAKRVTDHGFGLDLDFYTFNPEDLVCSIKEILSDKTYAIKAKQYSAILRSSGENPRETVANNIEHVIKYGGKHLRSSAMDMSLFEFLLVDVLSLILGCCMVAAVVVYILVRVLCSVFIHFYSQFMSQRKLKTM